MDRTGLLSVIQMYGEELRRIAAAWPGAPIEQVSSLHGALVRSCERAGLPFSDVVAAIQLDPSLVDLADAVTREALAGAPDPGPYDVISREASSGTPENRHTGAIGTLEVGLPWEDRWW